MSDIPAPDERDDGSNFPPPRPFQIAAHEALRQGFREGHKNQVVMAATGSGKTVLSLKIIHEAMKKGKRTGFLCDRTALINQTSAAADRYGLTEHGVIQANHWRRRPDKLLQIALVQTIAKREYWPPLDLLIVDECFPGETLISTPNGLVEIRTLSSGDLIYNACGIGKIDSIFSKKVTQLCTVRMSDGNEFKCTLDHPIFTDMGWRPAGSLAVGTRVFHMQDMPRLLTESIAESKKEPKRRNGLRAGSDILFHDDLQSILCQEIEKSDAQRRDSKESIGCFNSNGAQAQSTRRQWYWHELNTSESLFNFGQRLDARTSSQDIEVIKAGIPTPLQSRFSQSEINDCNRVGREQSLFAEKTRAGQEEGCFASQPWVESVEIEEQGSPELVYNLRVSGHPSYFANGVLVHNCHSLYKIWVDYATQTRTPVIGLSATPFAAGLGKIFTNLVNVATMHDLTQQGILVPMRILSCVKPDMAGAATAGGEWTDKAAEERELEIVGDVVTEWLRHGENRKTIAFGATIKHCEELCKQFISSGVMAATYTSETSDSDREMLLEEFKKPDSFIRVLISVDALAKGFDQPDVSCLIDARPLRKSLSTAIQMWGRALRSSPGKSDAILLDHSGNVIRFFADFNEIYFNGLSKLDDGEALDKAIRKEEEFSPKGCPRCGYKPFHKRCMGCGYEKVSQSISEAQPGQMTEIYIGEGKQKKKLADNPEHLWNQVVSYARACSAPEKQSGRAWHLYKQMTGQETQWKFSTAPTVEVTQNVYKKIQSMNISYARAKKANV